MIPLRHQQPQGNWCISLEKLHDNSASELLVSYIFMFLQVIIFILIDFSSVQSIMHLIWVTLSVKASSMSQSLEYLVKPLYTLT